MEESQTKAILWCNICELKGDEKSSSFWCFECDQFLCDDCNVQHGYSKLSKDHCEISINNYNALPNYIRSLKSHCTEHDKLFELFCPDHNEPCCVICTSGAHGSCKRLFPISKIVKESTKEELFSENYRHVDEISKYILSIQEERKGSLSNFSHQIQECEKQFKRIRQEMNDIFDDLETKMLNSLKKSFELYSAESQQILEDLQQNDKNIIDIKNETDMLLQHASTFHAFIGRSELQRMVGELENTVQNYLTKSPLQGIDTQTLFSVDGKSLFEDTDLDRTIQMVKIPSSVKYIGGSCTHAQMSKTLEEVVLCPTDISMNFRGRFDCNIVGCAIRDTGEYVFCDFSENGRIIIFRPNGLFERIIKTRGQPCCLTFVDNMTIAVTFPNENKVKIIDYHSGSIIAETVLETRCFGIAVFQNKIAVCFSDHMCYLELQDKTLHVISKKQIENMENAHHLHSIDDILIVGNRHEICTLNKDFSVLKKHKFEEMSIEGITSDSDNNIYLSFYESHRVIVMSGNGELEKVLLKEDDGLQLPTGLCFEAKKNQILVVTDSSQCACVFDLKR